MCVIRRVELQHKTTAPHSCGVLSSSTRSVRYYTRSITGAGSAGARVHVCACACVVCVRASVCTLILTGFTLRIILDFATTAGSAKKKDEEEETCNRLRK